MPPSTDASELITMSWSSGSESPYACSDASSTSANSTCDTRLPPNSITALRGVVRMPFRLSLAAPNCGATTPCKRRRSFGTTSATARPTADDDEDDHEPDEALAAAGVGRREVAAREDQAVTTRMTWTTMLASEFSTPELAATATFWPCFWKKRMTSAVVATVPPTRPVKLFANCSPTTAL